MNECVKEVLWQKEKTLDFCHNTQVLDLILSSHATLEQVISSLDFPFFPPCLYTVRVGLKTLFLRQLEILVVKPKIWLLDCMTIIQNETFTPGFH